MTCLIALYDTTAGNGAFCLIPGSHKCLLPHPYAHRELEEVPPLRGSAPDSRLGGRLYRERLPCPEATPSRKANYWLEFQYGPSYVVNWPGCESSADLLQRTEADPVKSHLLLPPYYHPAGSQKKMG